MEVGERKRESGIGKGETDIGKENKYIRMERKERERKGKL